MEEFLRLRRAGLKENIQANRAQLFARRIFQFVVAANRQ
jgi:hypothetical protein